MKNTPSLFMFLLVALAAVASDLQAKDRVIYRSDFGESKAGWTGRAGAAGQLFEPVADVDPAVAGKPVLKVTAGGTLGAGLFFICPAEVEAGREYVLTFAVRCTGETSLAARISQAGADEYGEEVRKWFVISEKPNRWSKIERTFIPTTANIGLEIGAELEEFEPCEILIKDVVLTEKE